MKDLKILLSLPAVVMRSHALKEQHPHAHVQLLGIMFAVTTDEDREDQPIFSEEERMKTKAPRPGGRKNCTLPPLLFSRCCR
jgi:hypothetical protein